MKYIVRYSDEHLVNRLVDPSRQTISLVDELPVDALAVDELAAKILAKLENALVAPAAMQDKPKELCKTSFFNLVQGDELYMYEIVSNEIVPEDAILVMDDGWIEELGIQLSWRKVTVQ